MKKYPSIDNTPFKLIEGKEVIAFDKIDGSNIRAEWTSKKGFYKFGSRNKLIDEQDIQLGESVKLIKELEEKFNSILSKKKSERVICFFEYWGDNSCFGNHFDEEHRVSLIDVSVYKKGIIPPDDFIKWFDGNIPIAPVLYRGKIDREFYDSVKNGTLNGIGLEGVVCKSGFDKKIGVPWMVKIKRQSWFDKLKDFCNGDENKFKELS